MSIKNFIFNNFFESPLHQSLQCFQLPAYYLLILRSLIAIVLVKAEPIQLLQSLCTIVPLILNQELGKLPVLQSVLLGTIIYVIQINAFLDVNNS